MAKVYIAPNASLVGELILGENVNIWYGAVLRGDSGAITVGEGTNIQDNCVLHEKTSIGRFCTVGHGAVVHGCAVGDNCLIGMGSVILNGAELGEGCLVGAGALVTGKMKAPAGSMLLGNPAKVVRQLSDGEIDDLHQEALEYIERAQKHLEGEARE